MENRPTMLLNLGGYSKLQLAVRLVQDQVILFINHSVAVATILREDLEASPQRPGIIGSKESRLRPTHVPVVRPHFRNLLFVTLDPPKGTDIVSVHPVFSVSLTREGDQTSC